MGSTKLDKQWEIFSALGIRWETIRELTDEEVDFLHGKALYVKEQIELAQKQRLDKLNN
jgi:uncharacterized protein YlzI (FlbEa/FlbD family)